MFLELLARSSLRRLVLCVDPCKVLEGRCRSQGRGKNRRQDESEMEGAGREGAIPTPAVSSSTSHTTPLVALPLEQPSCRQPESESLFTSPGSISRVGKVPQFPPSFIATAIHLIFTSSRRRALQTRRATAPPSPRQQSRSANVDNKHRKMT